MNPPDTITFTTDFNRPHNPDRQIAILTNVAYLHNKTYNSTLPQSLEAAKAAIISFFIDSLPEHIDDKTLSAMIATHALVCDR